MRVARVSTKRLQVLERPEADERAPVERAVDEMQRVDVIGSPCSVAWVRGAAGGTATFVATPEELALSGGASSELVSDDAGGMPECAEV